MPLKMDTRLQAIQVFKGDSITMRFSRVLIRHGRLSRTVLPALILFILYILAFLTSELFVAIIQHIEAPAHKGESLELLLSEYSHSQRQERFNTEELPIKYNLMEESFGRKWAKRPEEEYISARDCTVEYANKNKLQQDHPCVIRLIRRDYLRKPSPQHVPYRLDVPESADPSDGQAQAILRILQNKTNGFFVDCGGYDGEFLSNSLYMERSLNWTGLVIEADKLAFNQLINRNRKAYTSPVCLSTKPYPMEVVYNATIGTMSFISEGKKDVQHKKSDLTDNSDDIPNKKDTTDVYKMQCFPLYSLLIAVGRTRVDYFSLDVEGAEYKILKTIPWAKVDIKTLTVEWNHVPEGEEGITRLMESNKFIKFGLFSMRFSRDVVYVKDFLDDFREYEDE
ncbi:uncharacterized protein LOC116925994 isoform X2 [Daphnia magna]|uniref:uncharacterized protein LOC116925994 isoform X2 n=1 Tax=Daphnia magna TaxID=35525 RepID=UPI001E1BC716|nr:uncharacterized protein LOC116925994 isoform X2 [Daphnia magna]